MNKMKLRGRKEKNTCMNLDIIMLFLVLVEKTESFQQVNINLFQRVLKNRDSEKRRREVENQKNKKLKSMNKDNLQQKMSQLILNRVHDFLQ